MKSRLKEQRVLNELNSEGLDGRLNRKAAYRGCSRKTRHYSAYKRCIGGQEAIGGQDIKHVGRNMVIIRSMTYKTSSRPKNTVTTTMLDGRPARTKQQALLIRETCTKTT